MTEMRDVAEAAAVGEVLPRGTKVWCDLCQTEGEIEYISPERYTTMRYADGGADTVEGHELLCGHRVSLYRYKGDPVVREVWG